jgi:Helicase HerA, central domain
LRRVLVGKAGSHSAAIDVDALLRTRMLVQANSGKGKSWLLRRLAEQFFGKVQVIIIDPEGEFATLREKFGYVLVGKGGETPADPRSSALVSQKLLELRASAVCDLYELKPATRHEWVQRFLDAMIDSPKNLWHSCIVIVDEAHVYCPEKGAGESIASEAMIGLATRGRKRGFSCIFATQRLGKLRKDAAAELLNVMIGGTFIDIDRKRAADALGVYGKKDQHKFFDDIKVLERGSFYALGPAISDTRILVKVGPVETTHPEAGSSKHAAEPPPAPEKVKSMLPKLADLPKTAEDKARTEAELKKEIRELKSQLRSAPPKTEEVRVADPKAIARAVAGVQKKFVPLRSLLEEAMKVIVKVNAIGFDNAALKPEQIKEALESTAKEIAKIAKLNLHAREKEFEQLKSRTNRLLAQMRKFLQDEDVKIDLDVVRNEPVTVRPEIRRSKPSESNGDGELTPYQRDILRGLAELEAIGRPEVPKGLAGAAAGKSHKSSTFERYTAALRSQGLIEYRGAKLALTESGREQAGAVNQSLSAEDVQQRLLRILTPYQQEIVKALIDAGGEETSWDELGQKIGKSSASSTFERYVAQLRSAEIVEYTGVKRVKAASWLFLE